MVVEKITRSTRDLHSLRTQKAANRLFTRQQTAIMRKVLALEKLNRRESESYSRAIKPKINAIIDFYNIAILVRNIE